MSCSTSCFALRVKTFLAIVALRLYLEEKKYMFYICKTCEATETMVCYSDILIFYLTVVLIYIWSTAISMVSLVCCPPNYAVSSSHKTRNCTEYSTYFRDFRQQTFESVVQLVW